MTQKFKKAKFRAVEFFLADADSEFGRRPVTHEYPQRDKPFTEDLGRKARSYQIEGYVVGDDVVAQRDALIAAIEADGPGILIHPLYGTQNVICASFSVKESSKENRLIRFTIHFTEAGDANLPSASADSVFQVKSSADVFMEKASANFESVFSVAKSAQFVVESAVTKLKAASAVLKSLTKNANGFYQESADLAFALRQLDNDALDLVNSPAVMAKQIQESFRLLSSTFDLITSPRSAFSAQAALVKYGATETAGSGVTTARIQEEKNRVASNNLMQRFALANAAQAASTLNFSSIEDASGVSSLLLDAADDMMLKADDADVYEALSDLYSQIAQAIPKSSQSLPKIVTISAPQMMPSLVMVYRLFGNVDQELDVVTRNNLSHPGFIPAGTEIQVLGNG